MKKFKVTVYIFQKAACVNPQEKTTLDALRRLEFKAILSIRMGKVFLLTVSAEDETKARRIAEEACRLLLGSSVTEEYEIVDVR